MEFVNVIRALDPNEEVINGGLVDFTRQHSRLYQAARLHKYLYVYNTLDAESKVRRGEKK